jgi:hypothetical protein
MEPPGPAFGRPDEKLHVIRGQPIPDYAALHPGYEPDQIEALRSVKPLTLAASAPVAGFSNPC